MKRILILLLTFSLLLLTACGVEANDVSTDPGNNVQQGTPAERQEQEVDDAALSALRQEAVQANCPCAVACLNFETGETDLSAVTEALRETYSFLSGTVCVNAGGEDIYLIVPADSNAQLSVYRCELDDTGETIVESEPLADVSDGTVVLLQCNVSDIIPNALVRITGSNGEVFEFTPYLSLKDGRLGTEGVYDFTAYGSEAQND